MKLNQSFDAPPAIGWWPARWPSNSGELAEAEQHYAEALKLQPNSPVTRMSLAVVQLQSKDPKVIADSRITLELLNTDGKLGILPLRSLVAESVTEHDFTRAEQLSARCSPTPRPHSATGCCTCPFCMRRPDEFPEFPQGNAAEGVAAPGLYWRARRLAQSVGFASEA